MKLVSSASLIVGAALSLAACGQNNKSATKSAKKFPEQTAQKAAKKGGTLNYTIETDTPFKGTFDSQLSVDQVDSDVMQFGNESLFDTDNNYKINNKGAATFKLDKNAKGFPFNLKKANQLLDKAGYKKKGKWRVQPNGKPLNIHFLTNLSTTTKLQTGLTESHFWARLTKPLV